MSPLSIKDDFLMGLGYFNYITLDILNVISKLNMTFFFNASFFFAPKEKEGTISQTKINFKNS